MTVPTNIPETPMVHTKHESLHGSKGKKHAIPMDLIQHVFKTVLGMWNNDHIESLSHWVHYGGYFSFNDMYDHLHCNSDNIDKYDEYKVNGVMDHLNSNIMHKIKMFIDWMSKEMKDGICILHNEFLASLTREQFIEFRRGDIGLRSNSRSSYAEPYACMTIFTGHTKPTEISESQTALKQPIPSSRMIFTMIHFKDHS